MRHLLLLLMLSASTVAAAPPAGLEVSLGVTQLLYRSFKRSTPSRTGLDVGVLRAIPIGRARPEIGGGLRTAFPLGGVDVPLEAYGQARFAGELGFWHPAAGIELGLSGFTELPPNEGWPNDDLVYEQRRLFAPYVAFNAAPLRFRILQRWMVSAFELQAGATVVKPGAALRLQLGLIRIGGTL